MKEVQRRCRPAASSLCYLLRERGCESVLLWLIPSEAVLRMRYPNWPCVD
ncbi:hypothetical protein [Thermomonospora curvata]|nr:hypothetical protein [Thermomonospora curvata]